MSGLIHAGEGEDLGPSDLTYFSVACGQPFEVLIRVRTVSRLRSGPR